MIPRVNGTIGFLLIKKNTNQQLRNMYAFDIYK